MCPYARRAEALTCVDASIFNNSRTRGSTKVYFLSKLDLETPSESEHRVQSVKIVLTGNSTLHHIRVSQIHDVDDQPSQVR